MNIQWLYKLVPGMKLHFGDRRLKSVLLITIAGQDIPH